MTLHKIDAKALFVYFNLSYNLNIWGTCNNYCYNLGVLFSYTSSIICVKDDDFNPLYMQPLAVLLLVFFPCFYLLFLLTPQLESNFDLSLTFISVAAGLLLLRWDSASRTLLCCDTYSIYLDIYISIPYSNPANPCPLPHRGEIIIVYGLECFPAFCARLLRC